MAQYRVGLGYDTHRLIEGRKLILGGIEIAYDKGLAGHSDADVVLHAVTDALLGAAGLPDIGDLFPDTDPTYRNADSAKLLKEVLPKITKLGFGVENLDIVVHAEAPKLAEHKRTIADSIASIIDVESSRVGVKAKTQEGLGAIGTSEAMACTAVVLLSTEAKGQK